jgi:hypothetical protein
VPRITNFLANQIVSNESASGSVAGGVIISGEFPVARGPIQQRILELSVRED